MKNFLQKGDILNYKNTSGNTISSGDVIALPHRICIAISDISNGKTGSVQMVGVVSLKKKAEVMSFGDELHWDTGTKSLTKTPSISTRYAGMAAADAGSSDESVACRLQSGSSDSGE